MSRSKLSTSCVSPNLRFTKMSFKKITIHNSLVLGWNYLALTCIIYIVFVVFVCASICDDVQDGLLSEQSYLHQRIISSYFEYICALLLHERCIQYLCFFEVIRILCDIFCRNLIICFSNHLR